jgi:nitrous oxide reductase accessory protein NosL
MTIETDARAAQLVPARGATQVFDEPGCLLRHVAALPVLPDADRLWVRDGASGEWIDARTAVYAVPDRPREGMMYGVIAYRDAAVAARLAPGDRLADFASLLAELRS